MLRLWRHGLQCKPVFVLPFHLYPTATDRFQMCRFHIQYPTRGPYAAHDTTGWVEDLDEEDEKLWDDEWDSDEQELNEGLLNGDTDSKDLHCTVEFIKAHTMMGSQMCLEQCVDCQPLIFKTFYFDKRPECDCNHLYGHFCQKWRCIPCVLAEEALLVTRRQKVTLEYRYFANGKWHYSGVSNPMPLSPGATY